MIVPQLKGLSAFDFDETGGPSDPKSCSVLVTAHIGDAATAGADLFEFDVTTPDHLAICGAEWARGVLVVQEFSWPEIRRRVEDLVAQASRPTWDEAAQEINKTLRWEFDNYRAHDA